MKLTEEQIKLIEENIAFPIYMAKKYFTRNDFTKNEDIIQEAKLAMINAIHKYNPTKSKFTTYMWPTIDGHLKRYVYYLDRAISLPHQKHLKEETQEMARRAKIVYSLDKKIYPNGNTEDEFTLLDLLPDESVVDEYCINKIVISDAVKSLNWREKIVIIYRFYFDLNQSDIGKLMGFSQVHVHRIEKKALNKLKKIIKEYNTQ